MPFQNVALVGKGALGSLILDELLQAGYRVTVLTRSASSSDALPPGATLKEVDYASPTSLEEALQGHDIVISTINAHAIPLQKPLIDAAITAGVRRFIPAEYSAMATSPNAPELPFHATALEIRAYLLERVARSEIEYTLFGVGFFAEYLFQPARPTAVDSGGRCVRLFDGGKWGFSISSLRTVARAVVSAIGMPEESRNWVFRVHDAVVTQAKVLEWARKWNPGEWTETDVDAGKEIEERLQSVQTDPERDPASLFPLFLAALMSGRYGAAYTEVDNELLGIEGMSEQEVEEFGYGIVSAARV